MDAEIYFVKKIVEEELADYGKESRTSFDASFSLWAAQSLQEWGRNVGEREGIAAAAACFPVATLLFALGYFFSIFSFLGSSLNISSYLVALDEMNQELFWVSCCLFVCVCVCSIMRHSTNRDLHKKSPEGKESWHCLWAYRGKWGSRGPRTQKTEMGTGQLGAAAGQHPGDAEGEGCPGRPDGSQGMLW